MKSLKKILPVVLIALLIWSCDVIEGPYTEGTVIPADTLREATNWSDTTNKVRKILLEEFTGHLCPNCPAATEIAHQLAEDNPGQLFLIAIHAGFFATPAGAPYEADYRTIVGDELFAHFGVTATPTGMVNRVESSGSVVLNKDAWTAAVSTELAKPIDAFINLSISWDETKQNFWFNLNVEFFTDITDDLYYCAFLTQDSIVSAQKVDAVTVPDYVHMHMLRASLNGTYGSILKNGGVNSGDHIVTAKTMGEVTNTAFDPDQMHLVVFIYNAATEEIIQTESLKLTEIR